MTDQTPTPSGPTSDGNFDMNKSTIISLLYIASFIVGITGLIGGILAFVWKEEVAGTWEESHLQYHIMTFIVGIIVGVVGAILSLVLIGIPILLALAVWILVRSVMALLKAQKQEPMADPKTLLF